MGDVSRGTPRLRRCEKHDTDSEPCGARPRLADRISGIGLVPEKWDAYLYPANLAQGNYSPLGSSQTPKLQMLENSLRSGKFIPQNSATPFSLPRMARAG